MTFDDIKESAAMAVATVRANKLRSSLTILGVAIGVVTLTFMVSIIQGLNKAFADQIESLGSNTVFVSKFDPSFGRPPGPEELHRKDITTEDAEVIRNEAAESIESIAPIRRKIAADIRYSDKETETPILFGVTPEYEYTLSQFVGRGRFVVDADLAGRENVAVLAVRILRA
ncbi:MAG: ABC transporter permease [Rubrivivax sp.]|nr:ABC transporter permease [Pyrinomonadaceae bacterium]